MILYLKRFVVLASRFSATINAIPFEASTNSFRRYTKMIQVQNQRAFCKVPDAPRPSENSISNKVFVQTDDQSDLMQISFEFNSNGKAKQFNLRRKRDETLASALERIRLNIGRLNRISTKKKKLAVEDDQSEFEPCLKFCLNDNFVDPNSTLNIDAWVEGAVLEVNGKRYQVSTNEPQIVSMKLPNPIMKGFIVLPNVILSNCHIENCVFIWYRRISADEREVLLRQDESREDSIKLDGSFYWFKLAESITYCPVDEDVAHLLKVTCYTSNGERWGLAHTCLSTGPVELGPKLCPFEIRHKLTKEKFNDDSRFRFITYNILADLYADSDYSRTVLFEHCPAHSLDIDYRRQLLLKELHGYNADIICLQEVDKKEFIRTYKPFFQLVTGHSGVFDTKGGQVAEGVAMFYRNERFSLVDSHRTILSKLIDPSFKVNDRDDSISLKEMGLTVNDNDMVSPETLQVDQSDLRTHPILKDIDSFESIELLKRFDVFREKILSHPPLRKRFLGLHTVLQTSLLRSKENPRNHVIVANTHLYFAPDADHIRLLQGSVCVKYIEYIKNYYKKMIATEIDSNDFKLSIVFCGDMNSTPDCGLFCLLESGQVSSELADWSSNKEEAVEGLKIETPLRFKSAYQNIPYTNFTPGFNGCLDYIYYELDSLSCESTVPLPDHEDVIAINGLPSVVFPSDHLALIANLKFRE